MDFSKLAGKARKLVDAARESAGAGSEGRAGLGERARTALDAARKGLKQAAEKAGQSPLAERSRELVAACGERLGALASEDRGDTPDARAARALQATVARLREAATREGFDRYRERATELLGSTRDNAKAMSDRAATSVAEFYTEHTGREVTPEQVKSVAIKVGVAVVVAATLSAMMQAGSGEGVAFSDGDGGGRADGFDNSFEGDVSRFFADKGGLNIETHVVDGDGVMLS